MHFVKKQNSSAGQSTSCHIRGVKFTTAQCDHPSSSPTDTHAVKVRQRKQKGRYFKVISGHETKERRRLKEGGEFLDEYVEGGV